MFLAIPPVRLPVAGIALALIAVPTWAAPPVDFARDIRPILSENCVYCHGPDESQRQAGLRLDTRDGALSIVDPNDRSSSEMMDRLTSDDPDYVMPPPKSNRSLTQQQIEFIGQWIDAGAKWEQHWSFRPIIQPPVPRVAESPTAPIRNPIDAFVQSQLVGRRLAPSPEADRRTLIRRLSLDLTGLPPTPAEVQRFVDDDQVDAYEQLVQRLLDSPAYGQRMAWNWLDAARYADTNGYQGDNERTMYPWRDWVVDAFNRNMPYDQFTIWQLAGDLIPSATDQQILATGFLRNHMINGEGGRIAEENRVEYVMDMSETTGTVWLGLTLNCCRCHDHKYDPITNEEYYQLFGFFNQTPVKGNGGDPQTAPNLPITSPEQSKHLAHLKKQLADIDDSLRQQSKQLTSEQSDWEKQQTAKLAQATRWTTLRPTKVYASRQRTRVLSDDSVLTSGPSPENDRYTVTADPVLKRISGLRIEALRHDTMTAGGLSRSDSSNFVLTGVEVSLVDRTDPQQRRRIEIASGEATFEQGSHKIQTAFDGDSSTGWAVYDGKPVDRDHSAALRFDQAIDVPERFDVEIVLRHDSKHKHHNIGRFRLSLTDGDHPKLSHADDQLIAAINVPAAERNESQKNAIAKAHRQSNGKYQLTEKRRAAIAKERDQYLKRIPKVMVMADMDTPRETFVLERGLYNKPTTPVQRAFPAFLPSRWTGDQPPDRLALAKWLTSDDHPLTARVSVNRLWQQFFGIGLVKTTEDFGRQGEIPVQMKLLDWLAADFRDHGWDVKELIRRIVTSHTYRQSSKGTELDFQVDPHNRLLARGARFRMPSWMLRDQALAISGLLSPVGGGPSVNSYQPPGVWEEASFGKKTYQQDHGEKLYRRSLYTFWRRIIAPTMFFDSASRQTCTVKSSRTNTPLHALQTLNNRQFVEAARRLAELTLQSGINDDSDRIDFVFQKSLARNAGDAERDVLLSALDRTRQQYAQDESSAAKLLSVGESVRDHSLDTVEHAAWATLCLAVLNFDETLTRE